MCDVAYAGPYINYRVGPWAHRNLFRTGNSQRMENLHSLGMSCHMACPKHILLRAPWKGGPQTPQRSAEEMLDGQCKRVDISAYARTAQDGLPQERLEEEFCLIAPHVSMMTKSVKQLT